jgi:hypothetical protein
MIRNLPYFFNVHTHVSLEGDVDLIREFEQFHNLLTDCSDTNKKASNGEHPSVSPDLERTALVKLLQKTNIPPLCKLEEAFSQAEQVWIRSEGTCEDGGSGLDTLQRGFIKVCLSFYSDIAKAVFHVKGLSSPATRSSFFPFEFV